MTQSASVEHLLYTDNSERMATSIGFRLTPEDERILREVSREGETTTETLRRGLRSLSREQYLERLREDARALDDEDLSAEPDEW
ncbi:hypothetical protein SAMN06298212_1576 [Ruaniaceae bacterium KH17]|nr:hypothetical protein SAMN06298212_1576 [Ruaniaceae bacterium KH17]